MILSIDSENSTKLLGTLAPFVTIIVTVILFVINRALERKHERFKKYLDKRIIVVDEAINVLLKFGTPNPFGNPDFLPRLEKTRGEVQLFGTDKEQVLFEHLITAIEAKDIPKINIITASLVKLFADSLRSEFGLPKRFIK